MSRPLVPELKHLRQEIMTACVRIPLKMDIRTKRSLGRSIQRLVASRSFRLSQWAHAAKNRLTKPLYEIKWASRLLANPHIDQGALAAYRLSLFGNRIQNNTPIAVDLSCVKWPYAKTVEGLCRVWDGTQKKAVSGHWWLKATARFSATIRLPLLSSVFSHHSPSFISMNTTIIDFVTSLFHATGGRGLYLFDRGFDRIRLIQPFLSLGLRFAIRMNRTRCIQLQPNQNSKPCDPCDDGEGCDPCEGSASSQKGESGRTETLRLTAFLKTVAHPFSMTLPIHKKSISIQFGFSPITLPKIQTPLWLIHTSGTLDPFILLTNEAIQTAQDAQQMIRTYASRWAVEESFRDFNEEFDAQHVMVRTLKRINLLFELALWAYSFAGAFFYRGKRLLRKLVCLGGRLGIKRKTEETFGRILKGLQHLFAHAASAP